jgi:hypothetical protein
MDRNSQTKPNKAKYLLIIKIELIILAAFGLIGLYFLALTNPNFKHAIAMATTVMPETFTELYFENHINLPTTFIPGKPIAFTFTLHNLEYKNFNYAYSILSTTATGSSVLATGSAFLNQDQYQSFNELVTLSEATRTAVLVDINHNQHISFWVEPDPSYTQTKKATILSTSTGWLRVRSKPDPNPIYEVARVKPGDHLPLIASTTNGWSKVEYQPGTIGWIVTKYAKITNQGSQ